MAIRYYDEALLEKIKKWVKDPNMHILGVNDSARLFQIKSDEANDQPLQLPIIALSRNSDVSLDYVHKRPMSFDGKMLHSDGKTSISLNAIPIKLSYQLDIYTRYSDEGDEYLRNFIFNFVNHPKLEILLPYNDINYHHISNVDILTTVSDNSDIDHHLFSDQFTRWTIGLTINDAYLFSAPITQNVTVELGEVEIQE